MQSLNRIISPLRFKALHKLSNLQLSSARTFLTENYYCYEKWDKYLMSDVIKNVGTINSFSIELDNKLRENSLITPLDMEILAGKTVYINNFQELEFIENIFLKFRKTQAALYVKDSMHYGLVRSYLDLNQPERLLKILKLKYKYGLYTDNYTSNMLMDYFIKESDVESAALCAHEVMLQEMCDNELTLAASLFSCVRCSIESKDQLVQENESSEEAAGEKRLVYFKRQEWNDDHFDLKSVRQLNGKTIWFSAMYLKTAQEALVNSCKIYGLLLYKKFDQVVEEFERVFLNEKRQLFAFLVDEISRECEQLNDAEREKYDTSLVKWNDLKLLCQNDNGELLVKKDILKELEEFLKTTMEAQEVKDIKDQEVLFTKWQTDQKAELEEQIKNFNIELKKSSILKRLDELEKQEEVLTYFDHKSEIVNLYHNQGFAQEDPSLIPIEPEETQFKIKFERHFKPYQKYAKRPEHTLSMSNNQKDTLESLRKIYFDNRQAQTMNDLKWTSKK